MVNKIKRNCKICKKAFWVWPSTIKYSKAEFCSITCGLANRYGGSNCLQKPYNIHRNRLKTLAFYY